MSEYDDDYWDGDYEEDEFERALGDCHLFQDGGVWWCGAAGSEHCDWDCPFVKEIGKPVGELLPTNKRGE